MNQCLIPGSYNLTKDPSFPFINHHHYVDKKPLKSHEMGIMKTSISSMTATFSLIIKLCFCQSSQKSEKKEEEEHHFHGSQTRVRVTVVVVDPCLLCCVRSSIKEPADGEAKSQPLFHDACKRRRARGLLELPDGVEILLQ